MKIGICIPVLNNFDGAIKLLHSVHTQHDWQPYIMDQWRNNRTLSHAWNQMMYRAFADGCDYAIVCNDDTMFAPASIDAMIAEYKRLRESEKVIMVTPNNILAELLGDADQILNYYLPKDQVTSWAEHPNYSCFLVAPEFLDIHGTFDENFIPAWYEDNDSHRRINLLGYKAITTTAAPHIHVGGVSTSKLENPNSAASNAYYVQKWGGDPGKEQWDHPFNDPNIKVNEWRRV